MIKYVMSDKLQYRVIIFGLVNQFDTLSEACQYASQFPDACMINIRPVHLRESVEVPNVG